MEGITRLFPPSGKGKGETGWSWGWKDSVHDLAKFLNIRQEVIMKWNIIKYLYEADHARHILQEQKRKS